MPRKSLPPQIERNATSLDSATPAEKIVIEQLPELWDRHDTITDMADECGWSVSHVGAVWRKYFKAAEDSHPVAPTTDGGVDTGPIVTIPVSEIPEDDHEALAFIKGVRAIRAD